MMKCDNAMESVKRIPEHSDDSQISLSAASAFFIKQTTQKSIRVLHLLSLKRIGKSLFAGLKSSLCSTRKAPSTLNIGLVSKGLPLAEAGE
jgi:hypothetical protein